MASARKKTRYTAAFMIRLIKSSSWAVRVSSSRLSRALAAARTPYSGMPNWANMENQAISDVAKVTFPIPTVSRIRAT